MRLHLKHASGVKVQTRAHESIPKEFVRRSKLEPSFVVVKLVAIENNGIIG